MVQTDLRTALRRTNEIEITVTGRSSGRSFSCLFIAGADAIGRLLYDALFALYFDGVV
jgi:hypothetical protein